MGWFFFTVTGAYILKCRNFIQWIGWSVCSVSCLIWIFMGLKDRDLPRTLMELMYFIIALDNYKLVKF